MDFYHSITYIIIASPLAKQAELMVKNMNSRNTYMFFGRDLGAFNVTKHLNGD